MVDIDNILKRWADGEKTVEQTNEDLKGTGIYVDPDKQKIADGEGAVYCADLSKINGMILVDDGISPFMSEVRVAILVCPIAASREQNVLAMTDIGGIRLYIRDGKTLEY